MQLERSKPIAMSIETFIATDLPPYQVVLNAGFRYFEAIIHFHKEKYFNSNNSAINKDDGKLNKALGLLVTQ